MHDATVDNDAINKFTIQGNNYNVDDNADNNSSTADESLSLQAKREKLAAAQSKDNDIIARRDFGRIGHGADPGRNTTAHIVAFIEGRVVADFGDSNFRKDGKIGKCRAAHIVIDGFALI